MTRAAAARVWPRAPLTGVCVCVPGGRIERFDGGCRTQLKVDRQMLLHARVVGQAFNKWIVARAGADIVLVDQVSTAYLLGLLGCRVQGAGCRVRGSGRRVFVGSGGVGRRV